MYVGALQGGKSMRAKKWDWKVILRAITLVIGLALLTAFLSSYLPRRGLVALYLALPVLLFFGMRLAARENEDGEKAHPTLYEWLRDAALVAVVMLSYLMNVYTFPRGGMVKLILIALIPGIALTLLFLPKSSHRQEKLLHQIPIFLIFAVLFVALCTFYTAHLNYVLDMSPSEVAEAEILGKDYYHRRKGPDHYKFLVKDGGEPFYLEVSSAQYDAYEIGNRYRFERYSGAFGVAFYTSGVSSDADTTTQES